MPDVLLDNINQNKKNTTFFSFSGSEIRLKFAAHNSNDDMKLYVPAFNLRELVFL